MNIQDIIFSMLLLLFLIFIIHAHIKPTYGINLYEFTKKYLICVKNGTKFTLLKTKKKPWGAFCFFIIYHELNIVPLFF